MNFGEGGKERGRGRKSKNSDYAGALRLTDPPKPPSARSCPEPLHVWDGRREGRDAGSRKAAKSKVPSPGSIPMFRWLLLLPSRMGRRRWEWKAKGVGVYGVLHEMLTHPVLLLSFSLSLFLFPFFLVLLLLASLSLLFLQ
jgi:hypothetical protein